MSSDEKEPLEAPRDDFDDTPTRGADVTYLAEARLWRCPENHIVTANPCPRHHKPCLPYRPDDDAV
jgi:hypothetical protein